MSQTAQHCYEFSGFRLDTVQRALTRDGKPVALTTKAIDMLLFLVENRGRVLEKDELMKALWPESFVEEGNLTHHIFVLRKALGDDQNGNTLIQTIPRRGYKFVAPVKNVEASPTETKERCEASAIPGMIPASSYWASNSPFRSLRAFDPEDSWLFFGRERETEDLLIRLSKSPPLSVIGNSGSGKSSLIRAGLLPALYHGRFKCQDRSVSSWRVALLRPSGAPFDYLAEILPAAVAPELDLNQQMGFIAQCREKLSSDVNILRNVISALANTAGLTKGSRILLVVDQFEEIFTLTSDQEIRERYINALLATARWDGSIPVHLVLVVRADFYANCLEHVQLSRAMEANLYNVSRMASTQLREGVEKRLSLAGGEAEAGLMDSLLADVGAEPGDLALLEHALGLLWEKCGGFGCTLTNKAYSEIGRLRGALGKHADEIYATLSNRNQHLAVKIFLELIQLGEDSLDTRRRIKKTHLLSLGIVHEVEQVLEILISGRLIASSGEGPEIYIEISHEALIREWAALRQWLTQSRDELWHGRRLLQAAAEWKRLGRDCGALLQGTPLDMAEAWLTKHPHSPLLLKEFLAASLARDMENGKRRNREARRLGKWMVGLFLSVIAIGAVIFFVLYFGSGLVN